MINATYADTFFVYFLLWLLLILFLWRREEARVRRNEWRLNRGQLFHCDNCHHSFIVKEAVNLCRCPKCNSICIFRKQRNLE